jgi:hypothetical protein
MTSQSEAGTRFKNGHKKKGGRRKGTRNKISRELKEATVAAAERAGEDGNGKGGLVGYMYMLAQKHRKTFAVLLMRVLRLELNGQARHERDVAGRSDTSASPARQYQNTSGDA